MPYRTCQSVQSDAVYINIILRGLCWVAMLGLQEKKVKSPRAVGLALLRDERLKCTTKQQMTSLNRAKTDFASTTGSEQHLKSRFFDPKCVNSSTGSEPKVKLSNKSAKFRIQQLLSLYLLAIVLTKTQAAEASIWPFGGAGHKSSSIESSKHEVRSTGQTARAALEAAPPPTLSQQFHYFWNHDKIEPTLVAHEATKILADAQAQTNQKTLMTMDGGSARRSSDPRGTSEHLYSSASEVGSESVPAPVSTLAPAALQQQLTALVLQMQRQLHQHQLLAQPRLDLQNRLIAPPPIPMANRFWGSMAPVISPGMIASDSMQSPASLMHPLRMAQLYPASLPDSSLAGVPVYGPYTVEPSTSLIRGGFARPYPMSYAPISSPQVPRSASSSKSISSRQKSWPFYTIAGRVPFLMGSASQPKVTVIGPPSNQRSSLDKLGLSNAEKQTLLEATSNQLAAAISSHLQARAAQRKLVSLLSQVMDQPRQSQDLMGSPSLVSPHFVAPGNLEYNSGKKSVYSILFGASNLPDSTFPGIKMESGVANNSSLFGNRLKRRQLNPLFENFTDSSFDLLREWKSTNSSRSQVDVANRKSALHEKLNRTSVSDDNSRSQLSTLVSSTSSILSPSKNAVALVHEQPASQIGHSRARRLKRSAWTPSGSPPSTSPTATLRGAQSTRPLREARFLKPSPMSSMTRLTFGAPLVRRLAEAPDTSRVAHAEITTVSSLQIPESPMDWSTPTKRADLFKPTKVKRIVSSATVFHHPSSTSRITSPVSDRLGSVISGEAIKFSNSPQTGLQLLVKQQEPQDIMSSSAAESARVVNYFQNVDNDRTTTMAPEPEATLRPVSSQPNVGFSAPASRYSPNRKSLSNETIENSRRYSSNSGQGNGLHVQSFAFSPPHQSAVNRNRNSETNSQASAASADISSSATRSVTYSASISDPTVNKPGQLETSINQIGMSNGARAGSTSRIRLDSSLSDDAFDMQTKLLDSLLSKDENGKDPAVYATTPPPRPLMQQLSSGNDRSPSADQSGSYNEELLPPLLNRFPESNSVSSDFSLGGSDSGSQNSLDQTGMGFSDGGFDSKVAPPQDASFKHIMELTRQPSPHSSLQAQTQQTFNSTPMSFSTDNLAPSNQEQSLGMGMTASLQGQQTYPDEQYLNPLFFRPAQASPMLYQPSIQQQIYAQQLQVLGSAVNKFNQNKFSQHPHYGIRGPSSHARDMYNPGLRNDYQAPSLHWSSVDDELVPSALVPSSIAFGNQNVANMIAVPGPNVNDVGNFLMAGSEQSRSEQSSNDEPKIKRSKQKPIKQVSHHYHINNFGFPVEDTDNPLDIAAAFATDPHVGYPRGRKPQKPTKSPKEEEQQNEEEEKPKKKKFLRRFSFKSLFKKLKKDKKKENVESEEESGNGGGSGNGESSEERRS